jgi:hypothetical protein
MASRVVVDDGRRCAQGTRVAFVPAAPGSRTLRMVEDAAGPFTLRSTACIRIGEEKALHVTVTKKKRKLAATAATEAPAGSLDG